MHKLLNSDGDISDITSDWLATATVIHTDTPLDIPQQDVFARSNTDRSNTDHSNTEKVVIEFGSASDGRGFSLIAGFRECNSFNQVVYASGALIPDQVSLAFQCGFDGIIITQRQIDLYGEKSWCNALTPLVDNGYVKSNWGRIDSIWAQRRVFRPELPGRQ